jgi:carbamoyl-phosphate synthase large subunit
MPARTDIESILIIGSGPIVIGQACEFDYSGVQAVRALKEGGYRVVLVNPNPATVMTTPGLADRVYVEPLTVDYVEEVLRRERPDALLPTMGGQTALNLALALHDAGALERHGIEMIGANVEAIRKAEDRGSFKKMAEEIGLDVPRSLVVKTVEEALTFEKKVGLPLIIRPSFTLGGQGGAIAETSTDLRTKTEQALSESMIGEALIEESLLGWKEFELEVMRDHADNAMVICSIENVDPMGIHTGDSITVAPIQTLSDREYQALRTASLDVLRAVGVDCGGSNVQFAIDPRSGRMVIIEMNPRVSRSSALASKATGFPIARCSARLAVGFTLDEIINEITGRTVSSFEPSLDYVVVKVPRFELEKFPRGYDTLGTQMKSVGESLAIGRTFNEALNKAIRAGEFGFEGLEEIPEHSEEQLRTMVETLHPMRIFALYRTLLDRGEEAIPELSAVTGYDPWFLHNMALQCRLEQRLRVEDLSPELLLLAKKCGLSDKRIARLRGAESSEIEDARREVGIEAVYHFVDTCAGEFEATTPYFYATFGEIDEGDPVEQPAVIILASGPNRIGQGLEFDACCTLASFAYRRLGVKTIIVNANPETVSTDFNTSDRLYMEPLVPESVREVMRKEKTTDVVVQLGGQTPLNMATELEAAGARIVGTPVGSILDTEDRELFAALMSRLRLRHPDNRTATSPEQAVTYAEEIGYPVLVRPSFVIGGRSMFIAYSADELAELLARSTGVSARSPVLVDRFLEDAYEYDVDAVCDGTSVYIAGIMQHIEAAGIHSGDSACVFPPFKSDPAVVVEMEEATRRIALEIGIRGFLNVQFAAKGGVLYVLEVNPRASRTIPFLSKASGVDLVETVVRVWNGESLRAMGMEDTGVCRTGWAVKEAVFSFQRLPESDPVLGPEMKSTGEVIGTGETFGEAFAKAQASAGSTLPISGRAFVSVNRNDRETILPIARALDSLGFQLAATRGTAQFLFDQGLFPEVILKVHEGRPNVIDHLMSGRIALLINTPLGEKSQYGDEMIRMAAVRRRVPYTTTTSAAWAAVEGIKYLARQERIVRPLPEPAERTRVSTQPRA